MPLKTLKENQTPKIGQRYLVPCALYPWRSSNLLTNLGQQVLLPLFGPRHNDYELLARPEVENENSALSYKVKTDNGEAHDMRRWDHYHIDWRFVSPEILSRWFYCYPEQLRGERAAELLARLSQYVIWVDPTKPFEVATCRRKCYREFPEHYASYQDREKATPVLLAKRCEELCKGARLNLKTMRCPHRGIPLGSIPPRPDGSVVCPGHGLRFSLSTGEMLPWADQAATAESEKV